MRHRPSRLRRCKRAARIRHRPSLRSSRRSITQNDPATLRARSRRSYGGASERCGMGGVPSAAAALGCLSRRSASAGPQRGSTAGSPRRQPAAVFLTLAQVVVQRIVESFVGAPPTTQHEPLLLAIANTSSRSRVSRSRGSKSPDIRLPPRTSLANRARSENKRSDYRRWLELRQFTIGLCRLVSGGASVMAVPSVGGRRRFGVDRPQESRKWRREVT